MILLSPRTLLLLEAIKDLISLKLINVDFDDNDVDGDAAVDVGGHDDEN